MITRRFTTSLLFTTIQTNNKGRKGWSFEGSELKTTLEIPKPFTNRLFGAYQLCLAIDKFLICLQNSLPS